MTNSSILHAFSIDVEDWYQSSHDFSAPISNICVQNTRKVIALLSHHETKGTFFVQGMVAKAFPQLVKEIHAEGHEIQSHGFSHRPVNKMSWKEFYSELKETRDRLEDITGEPIFGFRAPDFSIDQKSTWAFEVLLEAGVSYDSSIFPMQTGRYGVRGFKRGYSIVKTASGNIEELTVSVDEINSIRVPVGGGGYIRLLPLLLLRYSLNRFDRVRMPFVIYCHPYEFNYKEWRQISKFVSKYRRVHQGLGRRRFPTKISHLLRHKSFGTMKDAIANCRERKKNADNIYNN